MAASDSLSRGAEGINPITFRQVLKAACMQVDASGDLGRQVGLALQPLVDGREDVTVGQVHGAIRDRLDELLESGVPEARKDRAVLRTVKRSLVEETFAKVAATLTSTKATARPDATDTTLAGRFEQQIVDAVKAGGAIAMLSTPAALAERAGVEKANDGWNIFVRGFGSTALKPTELQRAASGRGTGAEIYLTTNYVGKGDMTQEEIGRTTGIVDVFPLTRSAFELDTKRFGRSRPKRIDVERPAGEVLGADVSGEAVVFSMKLTSGQSAIGVQDLTGARTDTVVQLVTNRKTAEQLTTIVMGNPSAFYALYELTARKALGPRAAEKLWTQGKDGAGKYAMGPVIEAIRNTPGNLVAVMEHPGFGNGGPLNAGEGAPTVLSIGTTPTVVRGLT